MHSVRFLVPALLALVACKKTVDTEGFSKVVEQKVKDMGLAPDKAVCASGVEAKVGNAFTCQVFFGAKTMDIKATITEVKDSNVQMNLEWVGARPVLAATLTPIAQKAMTDLGAAATVDCGAEPMLAIENGITKCKVIAGKTTANIVLKFDDKEGLQSWELEPKMLVKSKLEGALLEPVRAQTSPSVTINCGADGLIARPEDGNVLCDISDGQSTRKIKVAVTPDLNIEKWEAVQ